MGAAIRKRRPDVPKGVFYEGQVATRCGTATAKTSQANNRIMSQSGHQALVDIRKFKVALFNGKVSDTDGSEIGTGNSLTITAAVEYPAASGKWTQLTWNGGNTQIVIPDQTLGWSDYCTPPGMIPAGQWFRLRFWQKAGNNSSCYHDLFRDSTNGDLLESSGSVADATMGGTITNGGTFCFLPQAIIGPTNLPTMIGMGDSITKGINDTATMTDYRRGAIFKSVPALTGFINLSVAGIQAANYLSTGIPNRKSLFQYGTHFISFLGNNDIFNSGHSAATLEADCKSIWGTLPPRAKVTVCTITPRATSTDSWTTAGNETANANNGIKNTFNTDVRNSSIAGVNNGFFETAWTVENAHDDGKYAVDGVTAFKYTGDGIHPSVAGYNLFATDMTKIVYP